MSETHLPWKKKRTDEALSKHAQALFDIPDRPPAIEDERPELSGLFGLARQLAVTLVPVAPEAGYVADLKERLTQMQLAELDSRTVWEERRTRAARLSRIVGIAVSVIAIVALLARALGSILIIIAFIAGQRRKAVVEAR